jgi:precorrin-4 methylase
MPKKTKETNAMPRNCLIITAAMLCLLILAATVGAADETKSKGKIYVVGMGPAGPDLTAPRALAIVDKADVLLCSPRMPQRFAAFDRAIDPAKIAFDPWERIFDKRAAELKRSDPPAWAREVERRRREIQDFLRARIEEGQTVVLMDGGDPCVYGPSLQYILKGFDDRLFEVIPGMGAVNAAAAALKRSLTTDETRFVMLASQESLLGEGPEPQEDLLRDLAKYKSTLVLYMSLRAMGQFTTILAKHYPAGLPVAVVYFAGYADKEKVLRGTLADITEKVRKIDEQWLGLVVIGEGAR